MGSLTSKAFTYDASQTCFDGVTQKFLLDELCLTRTEINAIYSEYCKLAQKSAGIVKFSTIYSYYEIDILSTLYSKIFEFFSSRPRESLKFLEFACIMWNFLTLNTVEMESFIAVMYTNNDRILYSDIEKMVTQIHEGKLHQNKPLHTMLEKCKEYGIDMGITDFLRVARDFPVWIGPIMRLQFDTRKHMLGKEFWDNLTQKRTQNAGQRRGAYIFQHKEFVSNTMDVSLANDGVVKTGRLVQRKASRTSVSNPNSNSVDLVSYFGLSRNTSHRTSRGSISRAASLTNVKNENQLTNLSSTKNVTSIKLVQVHQQNYTHNSDSIPLTGRFGRQQSYVSRSSDANTSTTSSATFQRSIDHASSSSNTSITTTLAGNRRTNSLKIQNHGSNKDDILSVTAANESRVAPGQKLALSGRKMSGSLSGKESTKLSTRNFKAV